MARQYRLVTNGGYDFTKEGQIADLVEVEATGLVILRHDSWPMHPRGDRAWRFWPSEVEEVAAPKFKVGDAVRVKAGSPADHDGGIGTMWPFPTSHGKKLEVIHPYDARGETNWGVSHEGSHCDTISPRYLEPWSDAETWCETTKRWVAKPAATSLEAVVEPPAVKAPYIVMLRGKDGRLAPSSHPAEHMDRQEARDEAARLAKRHARPFEVWQQVEFVEPPAPPKPAPHRFSVGQFVRAVRDTRSIGGTCSVVAGQVVQVKWLGSDAFNSTPLQGSGSPGFRLADFEAVN